MKMMKIIQYHPGYIDIFLCLRHAYATLTRSLRPQCFLMVLTQVLPRGLRLPYAAMAPPYARMFCLRQFLRAAYATPTPLHF